jgi:hypothetical protein
MAMDASPEYSRIGTLHFSLLTPHWHSANKQQQATAQYKPVAVMTSCCCFGSGGQRVMHHPCLSLCSPAAHRVMDLPPRGAVGSVMATLLLASSATASTSRRSARDQMVSALLACSRPAHKRKGLQQAILAFRQYT